MTRHGEEIHVSELYAGRTGDAARIGASRGDAAVDESARAAYRARLAQLDRDLADAEADNDLGRVERVALERDALLDELRRNFDVKGRARRLGDTSERARKTVRARVKDAIADIEQADPVLGAHLRDAVRTGTFCSYQPAEPTSWTVREI